MPSRRHRQPIGAEVDSALGPAPASYAQPEAILLRLRRHGRRLVLPALVLIAVAAVSGFWVGALPTPTENLLAAAGAILIAALLGVGPILSWLATRTTVTTQRVIQHQGVLVRHRSEVPLVRVREVRSHRGLMQRMRGAGDIELLHGTESTLLKDVPGVTQVLDALQELVQRNYEHSTRAMQQAAMLSQQVAPDGAQNRDATFTGFW